MSTLITEAMVRQYTANVIQLYQQEDTLLRAAVRQETLNGKIYFFERLGPTAAVKKTVRHGDTPLVDSQHSRRACTGSRYEWADLIDDADKVRILIDPQSPYAINAASALKRAIDLAIIEAFTANAFTGEDGTTQVTFANDYTPARVAGTNGDWDFSGAAITLANILTVKKDLDKLEVPKDNRHIVITPAGITQLLGQATAPNFSSADYMMVKNLANGEINTGLGFIWHVSNLLPAADATDQYCFAWHRDAMGLATLKSITTDISPRPDKSNSTQVFVAADFGACRVQGEGVVRFRLNNTI